MLREAQQSLTPAVDWVDSLTDPGGLLLVPNLPPIWTFRFMGGVGKKKKKLNLAVWFEIFVHCHKFCWK
jgi:hypothetical protein